MQQRFPLRNPRYNQAKEHQQQQKGLTPPRESVVGKAYTNTYTMGFLSGIGNAARRTQLNAEIVLVDRELVARKREFGVELYDLIASQQTSKAIIKAPTAFKKIENKIKVPLELCSKDVQAFQATILIKEDEAFKIDAKRVDPSRKIGKKITDTAKESKLYVQVKQAQRQMRLRKEEFGLEIWDIVAGIATVDAEKPKKDGWKLVKNSIGKGIKGTVAKAVAKVDKDEMDVKACVQRAKRDIKTIEDQKQRRMNEIERMNQD